MRKSLRLSVSRFSETDLRIQSHYSEIRTVPTLGGHVSPVALARLLYLNKFQQLQNLARCSGVQTCSTLQSQVVLLLLFLVLYHFA